MPAHDTPPLAAPGAEQVISQATTGAPDSGQAPASKTAGAPKSGPRRARRRAHSLWRLAAGLALVALAMVLVLVARGNPVWVSESFRPVGRFLTRMVGAVFRIAPFSLFELVFLGLLLTFFVTLTLTIVRGVRRGDLALTLLDWFSRVFLAAAMMLFLFFAMWGLNYEAAPLADEFSLEPVAYGTQELAATTQHLFERLSALSGEVPRDENGLLSLPTMETLRESVLSAYRALGMRVSLYSGSVAPPKEFLVGTPYSHFNVAGMYMPLTGEACVVSALPGFYKVFSMAHEVGHSFGLAREDEANFSAYAACLASEDPALRYAGLGVAFLYCMHALESADPALSAEVVAGGFPEGLAADLDDYAAYLARYAGPLGEVGNSINDGYLKTMGQDEGVRSYGLIVDLVTWSYLAGIY